MKRNSSFEVLRMICVFEILIMHSFEGVLNAVSWQDMISINIINSICNMSSSCLMLITGWFGIKNITEKFIRIELMLLFWNMFALVLDLINNVEISRQNLLSYFMPVQSSTNWFVTGYLYISLFALFIERMIETMSKREFQRLLIYLLLLFSVLPSLFYFDITNTNGKGIIHLLIMYLLGRYLRRYQDYQGFYTVKIGLTAIGSIIVFASVLNIGAEMINMRFWFCRDCSIFMVGGAVCMLLLFAQFSFYNKVINFCSGNLLSVICGERIVARLFLKNWNETLANYGWGGVNVYYYFIILARCMTIMIICITIEKIRGVMFGRIEGFIVRKMIIVKGKVSKL